MRILTVILIVIVAGGCARWQPQTSGLASLKRACPLKRGPEVSDYGKFGVQGVYHFVVEGASKKDIASFLATSEDKGFGIVPLTVNINGKDTLISMGPDLLRTQGEVDSAFEMACGLGQGKVFLTHARYNVPDANAEFIRAR